MQVTADLNIDEDQAVEMYLTDKFVGGNKPFRALHIGDIAIYLRDDQALQLANVIEDALRVVLADVG